MIKSNIFKDYVCLKKYADGTYRPEIDGNRNGRFVNFTYNKKTKKVFIPSDQIKDVRDVSLIKELINEKIGFLIDHLKWEKSLKKQTS